MGKLERARQAIRRYADRIVHDDEEDAAWRERIHAGDVLKRREADLVFLRSSGAIDMLRELATKISADKLSVAKPSVKDPMEAILVFNKKGNKTGIEWDSIAVGVVTDGAGKKKLTVNGNSSIYRPEETPLLNTLFQVAARNPRHNDVLIDLQNPAENALYDREVSMKGRKPIRIPRARRG